MNHRPLLLRCLLGPLLGLPLLGGCGSEADHPTPASEATHATAPPRGEARTEKSSRKGGRWRRSQPDPTPAEAAPSVGAELGRLLESLGYADGSRAPSGSGVTLHDAERAFAGTNFFTSAHAEVAILSDMEGHVLHQWSASFADTLGADFEPFDDKDRRWWRRAWLFENGDVLALITGVGLLKLDARSRILWASPLHVHHDLAFEPDGGMVVLTREVHVLPRVDPAKPVVEDRVAFLDSQGTEKRSFSLLEALEDSEYREV